MNKLKIRQRRVDEIVILDLDGKITIGETNRQMHTALKELVANGTNKIVLNLDGVQAVDSSGLGELVAGYTTLKAHGGSLVIVNMPARVTDLMTITKLYTVFDVFETEAEALAGLQDELGTTQQVDTGFPVKARAGNSIH